MINREGTYCKRRHHDAARTQRHALDYWGLLLRWRRPLRRDDLPSLDVTEATAEPVSPSSCLAFLLLAARHDLQCTIIQRPLQRLRLASDARPPRRPIGTFRD